MSEMEKTQVDAVEDLRILLAEAQVDHEDRDFIRSLLTQFDNKGRLSDKQMYWVNRLLSKSLGMEQDDEPKAEELGDFEALSSLFQKAKDHLKYPKITMQTESGYPVQLSVAGEKAKYPGSINVTDGGPFGANTWYGRITQDGVFHPSKRTLGVKEVKEVWALLKKFAEDPAGTAAEYGKLTGNCCFCNSRLSDEKSTAVGYGPICAKNWGLPWGGKNQ